jgi:PAS domain S-box-containing protein
MRIDRSAARGASRRARRNAPQPGSLCVETSPSLVRIVVLAGAEGRPSCRDTLDALTQLGGDVEIEIVRDADACLAAAHSPVDGPHAVDAVMLDRAAPDAARTVLEALSQSGPPVVFVTADPGEGAALEAFRSGAADCVRVGPDYSEVLPVVVLEQVRRWRKQAARGIAERRIRDLQRYNEDIIHNLNSALVVVDAGGCVEIANSAAEEILGVEPGGLVGRYVWDWFVAPEFEPAAEPGPENSSSPGPTAGETAIGRTLSEGVRFKGAEMDICRSDGSVIPIGLSCSPLTDGSDPPLVDGAKAAVRGAVAIFQDLSEIRQLQRQVLQTEKMASIGQLAAGVAHEINNPMGFIHANLFQMAEYLGDMRQAWERVVDLQKAVQDLGPAAAGEHGGVEAIRQASDALSAIVGELDLDFVKTDFAKAVRESQDGAERIRHIVKDLRDFSHQGSGEIELADVNECIDSTASIAWTMMKHSVVLEKHYAELPPVRCHANELKQVFMNLLVNAYQSIEEKLAGAGGTETIEILTAVEGDGVSISVRDTGAGIDPNDQPRIFDPFFTTKEVGTGMGLGLSTSYSIVDRHEGRIEVDSRPGVGATFRVWLPIAGPKRGRS